VVEQAAKEEGGFAKLLNFVTSLLPIVIIGGLLYAGFFVKGTTDIKKVEPKAVERRDNFYSIIAPTDQVAWAVGTGGKIIRSKYLALDGVYHPIRNAIPNISTL